MIWRHANQLLPTVKVVCQGQLSSPVALKLIRPSCSSIRPSNHRYGGASTVPKLPSKCLSLVPQPSVSEQPTSQIHMPALKSLTVSLRSWTSTASQHSKTCAKKLEQTCWGNKESNLFTINKNEVLSLGLHFLDKTIRIY